MRQMADDGEHHVVVTRLHHIDGRAAALPEGGELLGRLAVRAGHRREDAPAIVEEFRKARFRPGLLRTGDGMAGNEMHAFGHMRADIANDGHLHRADIGEDRAGLHRLFDFRGHRPERADGHAEDDEVGILRRVRRRLMRAVDEADFMRALAGFFRARITRNVFCEIAALHRMADGTADKAEADQRDTLEKRFAHDAPPFMKSASASTTSRFASSVPTLRRRQSGSP